MKQYLNSFDARHQRNGERYRFLKWGQGAFSNFRVVPPGTGICHQVNPEFLAQTIWTGPAEDVGNELAYPDTLVGTDSHTTMVNGLAVLGWGVGGIEAVMLGQQISMLLPQVVGFGLTGRLKEGVTATDLVLTMTQLLRKRWVIGKFVEFYGPGLDDMTVADHATVGSMAPEYGATCGFFSIDQRTIDYLTTTGRDPARVALVKAYAEAQGMWRTADTPDPVLTESLHLDMTAVVPSLRGIESGLVPRQKLAVEIRGSDGASKAVVPLTCRIDTLDELEYFRNGGILQYVLRQLAASLPSDRSAL